MSKDWKKIAKASGLSIPDASLDRIAQTLDSLEADLRPLLRAVPAETDPAPIFRAAAEDGV